jgi:hypothetical protein
MHDVLSDEEQHYLEQARALSPVLAERAAATSAARDVLPEARITASVLGVLAERRDHHRGLWSSFTFPSLRTSADR